MRSRYRVQDLDCAHFITSTILDWLPVFTTPACCDILVRSLACCRAHKRLQIHAWVIMEKHFHAIVSGPALGNIIADCKKFIARALLEQFARENRTWLLERLCTQKLPHKSRSEHQVWQDGFHPKAIPDDMMMLQKSDYIHHNPIRRGWVASPEHWRYSSAHEWLPGGTPLLPCDPWR